MEKEFSGRMWRPNACCYVWGIEVLCSINVGPHLFNKSCFHSITFVVVVVVQEEEEEEEKAKEGSKPLHGFWNWYWGNYEDAL